ERRGSFSMVQSSDAADVRGLQPLGALLDVVLHTLILDQVAAAGALARAEVSEHVGRAVLGGDEAVALVGVEPGDDASSHGGIPSLSQASSLWHGYPWRRCHCGSDRGR